MLVARRECAVRGAVNETSMRQAARCRSQACAPGGDKSHRDAAVASVAQTKDRQGIAPAAYVHRPEVGQLELSAQARGGLRRHENLGA